MSGQTIDWMLKRNCSITPAQLGRWYGSLCLVSLGIVTYLSYSQGGVMHGGYGVTGVLATIYSLIGLILGILTLREKDIYRIFPVLGTILNVVALGGVSFLLYLGSRL